MVSNAKKGFPFLRLKPIQHVEPLSVHRLFAVKFALKGFLIILHPLSQQNYPAETAPHSIRTAGVYSSTKVIHLCKL